MFQILDTATLLQLLDATSEAVLQTIETGQWSGCIWPGNAEWDLHEACAQIRSLALHYAVVRHPEAAAQRYETFAQLLAAQGCPQGGLNHLEAEPLVHQALMWLWALAGGPVPPETPDSATAAPLPGGDPVAFTGTALAVLEALLFTDVVVAQQIATTFLRRYDDAPTQRALELVDVIIRAETARAVDEKVTCTACGAKELELWYSGQTWGDTLCEPCYEAQVRQR